MSPWANLFSIACSIKGCILILWTWKSRSSKALTKEGYSSVNIRMFNFFGNKEIAVRIPIEKFGTTNVLSGLEPKKLAKVSCVSSIAL